MSGSDRSSGQMRFREFLRSALLDFSVWLVIAALAAASFFIAHIPLGPYNITVSLAIATIQICLVGVFFMKLRHARALVVFAASTAFLFVAVLFALSLNDLLTRP